LRPLRDVRCRCQTATPRRPGFLRRRRAAHRRRRIVNRPQRSRQQGRAADADAAAAGKAISSDNARRAISGERGCPQRSGKRNGCRQRYQQRGGQPRRRGLTASAERRSTRK
jgi:hypothetical protein